ncbi:hypothetical protein [Nocardia macrotermitis]|nr:hypothetical protein [Nocardia macrotermitis]
MTAEFDARPDRRELRDPNAVRHADSPVLVAGNIAVRNFTGS